MRKNIAIFLLIFFCSQAYSQIRDVHQINQIVTAQKALAPLQYLASDELKGRGTRRPEIHVAAKYISDYLKKNGVKEVTGTKDYYQTFELKTITPAKSGTLHVNDSIFSIGKNLIQTTGRDVSLHAPVIYVGFANPGDLANNNVSGKIVLTNLGNSDSSTFQQGLDQMKAKQALLKEKELSR